MTIRIFDDANKIRALDTFTAEEIGTIADKDVAEFEALLNCGIALEANEDALAQSGAKVNALRLKLDKLRAEKSKAFPPTSHLDEMRRMGMNKHGGDGLLVPRPERQIAPRPKPTPVETPAPNFDVDPVTGVLTPRKA